jgi:DNA primase
MTQLSKHDISEYYSDPTVRKAILKQIKDRPLMAVQSLPSGAIYRRNRTREEPIQISQAKLNPKSTGDLAWYTDRRFSEFHPVIGKKTDQVWVDVDPGAKRDIDSLKPVVHNVVEALKEMPGIKDVQLAYSGGRGFHIRGDLEQSKNTDAMRKRLNDYLKQTVKEKGIVFRKPTADQVRLDTSTLKDTGSIRALYSLDQETGRVALPLTLKELAKFNPEDATLERVLQQREKAPGVPGSERIHDLPESDKKLHRKDWTLAVQEHKAERAGKHWDLRLVDPHSNFAHSWAVPKAQFPGVKSKPILAVRMPTHSSQYALTFGEKEPEEIV